MSTRLVLRLVIADHLPLKRRQEIRAMLSRSVRTGITELIEKNRLEIGEVLVAGEFLTEEVVESAKGHRTSQAAYVTDGKASRRAAVKRNTGKRYPTATMKKCHYCPTMVTGGGPCASCKEDYRQDPDSFK